MANLQSSGNAEAKARSIRDMFGSIAARYDFLNHFLSINLDRRWRRICVREMAARSPMDAPRILDVGCGTADLSIAFSRLGPVVGCDFCHPMLRIGVQKTSGPAGRLPIALLQADALELPFPDHAFDMVVSAFVLRNLTDMDRGLREMKRVLRPGGAMGFLDFGLPRQPLVSFLYRWYFFGLLPRLGRIFSGVDGPYGYLPASVQAFPSAEELKRRTELAGFCSVECRRLDAGVAVLVMGMRPD